MGVASSEQSLSTLKVCRVFAGAWIQTPQQVSDGSQAGRILRRRPLRVAPVPERSAAPLVARRTCSSRASSGTRGGMRDVESSGFLRTCVIHDICSSIRIDLLQRVLLFWKHAQQTSTLVVSLYKTYKLHNLSTCRRKRQVADWPYSYARAYDLLCADLVPLGTNPSARLRWAQRVRASR